MPKRERSDYFKKYNEEVAKVYRFCLRKEEDEELIDYMEECKANGHSYVDIIRGLFYGEPK